MDELAREREWSRKEGEKEEGIFLKVSHVFIRNY